MNYAAEADRVAGALAELPTHEKRMDMLFRMWAFGEPEMHSKLFANIPGVGENPVCRCPTLLRTVDANPGCLARYSELQKRIFADERIPIEILDLFEPGASRDDIRASLQPFVEYQTEAYGV